MNNHDVAFSESGLNFGIVRRGMNEDLISSLLSVCYLRIENARTSENATCYWVNFGQLRLTFLKQRIRTCLQSSLEMEKGLSDYKEKAEIAEKRLFDLRFCQVKHGTVERRDSMSRSLFRIDRWLGACV